MPWNGTTGDKIDISKLLVGFDKTKYELAQWVSLQAGTVANGLVGSSKLVIDIDGSDSGTATQTILFENSHLGGLTLNEWVAKGVVVA